MSERWRPIFGYEGTYEVSDHGRVRSLDRRIWSSRGTGFWRTAPGQVLKASILPSGHLHVGLKSHASRSNRLVHRLVLEAFCGPCPTNMEACHNDGDPTNNALANLRWDTRSANLRDSVRHGTNKNASKTSCRNGHPFSLENTRATSRGRACRTCDRENTRRWRARRNAEAVAA